MNVVFNTSVTLKFLKSQFTGNLPLQWYLNLRTAETLQLSQNLNKSVQYENESFKQLIDNQLKRIDHLAVLEVTAHWRWKYWSQKMLVYFPYKVVLWHYKK